MRREHGATLLIVLVMLVVITLLAVAGMRMSNSSLQVVGNMQARKFAENVGQNPVAGALMLANIVAARGALPIKIGEETIGAVGVSGAPGGDKDEVCAQAGIDKVKDQLK